MTEENGKVHRKRRPNLELALDAAKRLERGQETVVFISLVLDRLALGELTMLCEYLPRNSAHVASYLVSGLSDKPLATNP